MKSCFRASLRSLLLLSIALVLPVRAETLEVGAKARTLFRGALDENRAGNFGRALQLLFDAQKEDPNVLALDDEGLLANAAQWLEDELTRDDSDFHAHFQMAELKMLQGLPAEALPHYRKVIALAPGSPLANLAKPLVDDIRAQLQASSRSTAGSGTTDGSTGSGTGSSSSSSNRELEARAQTLQEQLEQSQQELARVRAELAELKARPDRSQDFENLRKEFDAYKAEAEVWRRNHILWLNSLSRGTVQYPR